MVPVFVMCTCMKESKIYHNWQLWRLAFSPSVKIMAYFASHLYSETVHGFTKLVVSYQLLYVEKLLSNDFCSDLSAFRIWNSLHMRCHKLLNWLYSYYSILSHDRCGQYYQNDSKKVSRVEQTFSNPGGIGGFLGALASSEKQDHFCSYWASCSLRMMKVLFP